MGEWFQELSGLTAGTRADDQGRFRRELRQGLHDDRAWEDVLLTPRGEWQKRKHSNRFEMLPELRLRVIELRSCLFASESGKEPGAGLNKRFYLLAVSQYALQRLCIDPIMVMSSCGLQRRDGSSNTARTFVTSPLRLNGFARNGRPVAVTSESM
jgi:hypothetical protein